MQEVDELGHVLNLYRLIGDSHVGIALQMVFWKSQRYEFYTRRWIVQTKVEWFQSYGKWLGNFEIRFQGDEDGIGCRNKDTR